jgi:hypothetical protein
VLILECVVFTAGWAAVFGSLVHWFNRQHCGSAWAWRGVSLSRNDRCGQWRAVEAFSFLSLLLWLATVVIGIITVYRLQRRTAA